jgi:nucleotide-binding universal stress UspA family protein
LTVIHSAVPLAIDPALVIAAVHVDQVEEQRRLASALVDAAAEQIRRSAPDLAVTTRILEGTPKDVIVEQAAARDATLIVLGSHGHGRFRRMMLGSVASAVVANAPCSVQVVRAKHLLGEEESAA